MSAAYIIMQELSTVYHRQKKAAWNLFLAVKNWPHYLKAWANSRNP
jgi:hypothetical protein